MKKTDQKIICCVIGLFLLSELPLIGQGAKAPVSSILPDNETAKQLNVEANTSSNRAAQACAIFALFAHHLRPGYSAAEVHDVLTDTSWVDTGDITAVEWIMGQTPIGLSGDRTVYDLHLFPKETGTNRAWIIEFSLTGADRSAKDALAFLRGDITLSGNPRMDEFALIFPQPPTLSAFSRTRIEVFSKRGLHLCPE